MADGRTTMSASGFDLSPMQEGELAVAAERLTPQQQTVNFGRGTGKNCHRGGCTADAKGRCRLGGWVLARMRASGGGPWWRGRQANMANCEAPWGSPGREQPRVMFAVAVQSAW